MMFKSYVTAGVLFLLVPVWLGYLPLHWIVVKERAARVLMAWMCGMLIMFAVGQAVLVPMIAWEQSFSNTVNVFYAVLTLLGVAVFCLRLPELMGIKRLELVHVKHKKEKENKVFVWIFGVSAVLLILLQAWIPFRRQHIDDDDARFVAEEVSAVVHDTMLKDDPITTDFMYWNLGEVRKDLVSPWTMYVALCSRTTGLHPAVFSHTLFPLFMIPGCYILYGLIGFELFSGNLEKTFLFLIFLSVLLIWDYTSTHTLGAMLLLRIWQGKAVVAAFLIPALIYQLWLFFRKKRPGARIVMLAVTAMAASLLSGVGIITVPVLLAGYGFLDFCYKKNPKRMLAVWAAALPCACYMGYYLSGI